MTGHSRVNLAPRGHMEGTGLKKKDLKRFREIAASHEEWIIELLGGLSQEDRQMMLGTLGKLKAHLNAVTTPESRHKLGLIGRRK